MELSINLPKSAPAAQLAPTYLKQALVATLYQIGTLSSREACATLDITRRAFEELLPQFGFAILNDGRNNIEIVSI